MLKELVKKNRSYRRFYEEESVSKDVLLSLVDHARLTASGANKQPLKYYLSCDKETNAKIFPSLIWAGYLKEWPGPEAGERPSGYIILLHHQDDKMVASVDHGIAAQTMLLAATEAGLGGCIIASIQREQLKEVLNLPADYEILLVLALGKPKEQVVIDEIESGQDIKYWRDAKQVHHVPKRKLKDIVLNY